MCLLASARMNLSNRQSPEKTSQKCAAGRDALRITGSREVKSAGWIPQDHLPESLADLLTEALPELRSDRVDADGECAGLQL